MTRGLNRAERLREMERLYVQRAYSDIEMAERLEIDRSTVYRDRLLLETEYPFIQDETRRWKIDKNRYLSEIKVNLHEALVLYLAARRAAWQIHVAQPHVANALEKLALALKQPMAERLNKAASLVISQAAQPGLVKVLETIAHAWVEHKKVHITYRSLSSHSTKPYTVSPYLIEPSLWSDGAYLIGFCDEHNDITTFKIERIQQAALTGETFNVPQTFDDQLLLKYAWGIWYSDQEPVTVKLRFVPGEAARRLKESVWHPTQQITDTADGGCLWTGRIAEPQEMLPWIRGWGADVEVLEPDKLREQLKDETQRMAMMYSAE